MPQPHRKSARPRPTIASEKRRADIAEKFVEGYEAERIDNVAYLTQLLDDLSLSVGELRSHLRKAIARMADNRRARPTDAEVRLDDMKL